MFRTTVHCIGYYGNHVYESRSRWEENGDLDKELQQANLTANDRRWCNIVRHPEEMESYLTSCGQDGDVYDMGCILREVGKRLSELATGEDYKSYHVLEDFSFMMTELGIVVDGFSMYLNSDEDSYEDDVKAFAALLCRGSDEYLDRLVDFMDEE